MNTLVKIRFIPLAIGLAILAAGAVLHFLVHAPYGYTLFKAGIMFSVVGFLFLQSVRQIVRERKEKAEHPEPVKTAEEAGREELKNEEHSIKNRGIPASMIRLVFSVLVFLFGVSLLIDGQTAFGAGLMALALLFGYFSARWTIQYFRRLKEIRNK
jgi:hypothetical protein